MARIGTVGRMVDVSDIVSTAEIIERLGLAQAQPVPVAAALPHFPESLQLSFGKRSSDLMLGWRRAMGQEDRPTVDARPVADLAVTESPPVPVFEATGRGADDARGDAEDHDRAIRQTGQVLSRPTRQRERGNTEL